MAFIFGAFGPLCKSLNPQELIHNTELEENLHDTVITDQLVIIAGRPKKASTSVDDIITLTDNQGIFIGKIFDSETYKQAVSSHFSKASTSNPALLLKRFWGRYVAVLYNKDAKTITLMRDPLGLSTMYYMSTRRGVLFSTELFYLYQLSEQKPSLNWDYFADYIINENNALESTPFDGIKELLPGMALSFSNEKIQQQHYLWNIPQDNFIYDKNAFEEELLSTLKRCVKAWGQDSKGIAVELSGGLDSSALMILLSTVFGQDKKLIAINYIDNKTTSMNECIYAQEVADECGVPLIFLDNFVRPLLSELPASWRPNNPNGLFFYEAGQYLDNLVLNEGCDIIMNGQGGDHVFLAPPPKNSLADLLISKRFRHFPATMRELSELYGSSWLSLFNHNAKAMRHYYWGSKPLVNLSRPYLNPLFVERPQDFYLKDIVCSYPPAKAAQIESLHHAVNYAERNRSKFTVHAHPLLSQPLVELALQIPTYQSFENGYNRIFLRKAVSRIKNVNVIWRRSKSKATGSIIKKLASDSDTIRYIIAHGSLAKNEIINLSWFNNELNKTKHGYCDDLWPLMHIISSQLWLNQWGF